MQVGIAKISTKGQIVIPSNIRENLQLEKDDRLVVMADDNEIIIRPVKDILNTDRKKSKFAEDFIKAMKHDKILTEMEQGKEISIEEAL